MRTRNKPVLIFFCLLLSAAAVLAGVNIYSELKERQKEKKDFASVAEIAKLPMTEAPAESVTDTETETSAEPTEQSATEHNIPALIAVNGDCIGWLSIDGTSISYPVMYTPSEPQKYLRRSFYGLMYSITRGYLIKSEINCGDTSSICFSFSLNNTSKNSSTLSVCSATFSKNFLSSSL